MKATKAYIASLGTTGVLLGASILMLAVVSAVVAFDGWPNGRVSTRVQTLVLTERAAPIRIGPAAPPAGARAALRAAALLRGAARATVPAVTGVQRVAGERVAGHGNTTGTPQPTHSPVSPITPPPIPPIDTDPSHTRNQLADSVQSSADTAGVSVGKVNQDAGQSVTTTGDSAANAVRNVPVPGPLLP